MRLTFGRYIYQVVFHLTAHDMAISILDPHVADLLRRVQQGYTQRMLLLYLRHQKYVRLSQPSLSRWLSQHCARPLPPIPPDAEFEHYQTLCRMGKPTRTYRRSLTKWRGHIQHMREQKASLYEILDELKRRGVHTSIRSIRRELTQ